MGTDYSLLRSNRPLTEVAIEFPSEYVISFAPLSVLVAKLVARDCFEPDPHAAIDDAHFAAWMAKRHPEQRVELSASEGLYFIEGDCELRIALCGDPVAKISIDHGQVD